MKKALEQDMLLPKQSLWSQIKRHYMLLLLLLPAVVLVFIFSYLPMAGLVLAFQDFDIIKGVFDSPFVGLDNFVTIFTMPKFLLAIKNTIFYSAVTLFFGTPFPIILALLFNEIQSRSFKRIVQTVSYLPYFLSWISVIGMFYSFFARDGIYNDIMAAIIGEGYTPVNILQNSDNFVHILFWSNQWKNIGWNSIIFLAAIAGIDSTLYEAATIDGCSKIKQVWYITLPCLLPTIAIVFIMATSSLVTSNFEQVYGFQNVYIQEQTETINTVIFRRGIQNAEYSLSTAFGLSQGIISFLIVFISNKIVKKVSGIGIW